MHAITLAAGALAAALVVGATSARAADLDYGPPNRYSAYEDPRYRDLYGPEPGPVPPGYIYREHDRYAVPPPEPRRYSHEEGYREGCVPREEIKRRLVSEGWRDFYDLDLHGDLARIKARRPSGDLYALKIDRCTGDIARAHLLERGGHGPYAYDDRRGPYGRPYY